MSAGETSTVMTRTVLEVVPDAALKLCYCKLTVTRTDVYGRILLLLHQLEVIQVHIFMFFDLYLRYSLGIGEATRWLERQIKKLTLNGLRSFIWEQRKI